MALSTAIFVGEASNWLPELAEKARHLKVSEEVRRVKEEDSQSVIQSVSQSVCVTDG